jgi:hypothetical protein
MRTVCVSFLRIRVYHRSKVVWWSSAFLLTFDCFCSVFNRSLRLICYVRWQSRRDCSFASEFAIADRSDVKLLRVWNGRDWQEGRHISSSILQIKHACWGWPAKFTTTLSLVWCVVCSWWSGHLVSQQLSFSTIWTIAMLSPTLVTLHRHWQGSDRPLLTQGFPWKTFHLSSTAPIKCSYRELVSSHFVEACPHQLFFSLTTPCVDPFSFLIMKTSGWILGGSSV